MYASFYAKKSDVGNVMLAAGVGATRDVGSDATYLGQASRLESLRDCIGQTPRLGNRKVASICTGAGDNVAG